MSRILTLAIGFVVISQPAVAKAARCPVDHQLVPTAEVARGIAEAIIRGRQTAARMAEYVLHVQQDEDNSGRWTVFQGFPPSPPDADGNIIIRFGGGGLGMRIDKCTAKVTKVHYQR